MNRAHSLGTDQRVLVTGATGFLGNVLTQHLMRTGTIPYCLIRSSASRTGLPEGLPDDRVLVAPTEATAIVDAVQQAVPDLILHCAGRVLTDHRTEDIDDLLTSNILFFGALLEGMAKSIGRIRMVNVGTYLEHDTTGRVAPNSLYAASKRAALEIARYYAGVVSMQMITLKPSLIYGPGDPRPRLLRMLIEAAITEQSLDMSPGDQIVDLVHVDDVVDALCQAAAAVLARDEPFQDEVFCLSGEALSLKDLVSRVERQAGPVHVNWGGRPYKASEVMNPFLAGETLAGWRPRITLDEGIAQMLHAVSHGQSETRIQ